VTGGLARRTVVLARLPEAPVGAVALRALTDARALQV